MSVQMSAITPESLKESSFRVPKMDCASEEQLVRLSLGNLDGVKNLSFDLGQRTVAVTHEGAPEAVRERLVRLGLGHVELLRSEPTVGDHAQPSAETRHREARVLRVLLAINAVMFFTEFSAGLVAESTGLIADSLDMFADAAVYGVALYAVGKAAHLKLRAAHVSGVLQLLLALFGFAEVIRRFVFGAEPEARYMIGVALIALVANVACLWLISRERSGEAHMRASRIFSANDVIANLGVIAAGGLVAATGSMLPDLIVGTVIAAIVLRGAVNILRLK